MLTKVATAISVKLNGKINLFCFLKNDQKLIGSLLKNGKVFTEDGRPILCKDFSFYQKKCTISVLSNSPLAGAILPVNLFCQRTDIPKKIIEEDILDLEVRLHTGEKYGQVVAMENFGAGDLLEVRIIGKKNTEYFVMHNNVLLEINLLEKYLVLRLPQVIDLDREIEKQELLKVDIDEEITL